MYVCTYGCSNGAADVGQCSLCSAVPSTFNRPVRLTLALETLCIFTGTCCCSLTMVVEVYDKTPLY